MKKTWMRWTAGSAIVMMSAFGLFGGCFDNHENCGPYTLGGPRYLCEN